MNNGSGRGRTRGFLALTTIAITVSSFVVATRAPATGAIARQQAKEIGGQQPGIAWELPGPMQADLAAMQRAGMKWVRVDFAWSSIQDRGRDSWNWDSMDVFVRAANAHHLHVLGMLAYSPKWARSGPSDHFPPKDPADFANFARAVAQRYARLGVHTWEIWNEPNLGMFWSPRADPVAYATLLRGAYSAIKHADRSATVVSGGLAPAKDRGSDLSPTSFLAAMYWHGVKGSFDALGLHPYSYPYAPMKKATWNVFYNAPNVHKVMASVGDAGKPIWGTEIGFPTGTDSKAVSEQAQAADLVAAITAWRRWSFTGPLFIFQLRDTSTKKSSLVDNMGLMRWDGQPKPAYTAISRKLR